MNNFIYYDYASSSVCKVQEDQSDFVKASNIPQTLYIPNGCNLTLMNMKILSSVRIVVESTLATAQAKSAAIAKINQLHAGSSTALHDGWKSAAEMTPSLG